MFDRVGMLATAIATLALAFPNDAPASTYLSRTIDVPGATGLGTIAFVINDSGLISGTYWVAVNGSLPGDQHGFLDNNGSLSKLDVPGAGATVVIGINNAGEVVGGTSLLQMGTDFFTTAVRSQP